MFVVASRLTELRYRYHVPLIPKNTVSICRFLEIKLIVQCDHHPKFHHLTL